MTASTILGATGAGLGFVGSVVLAFAVDPVLTSIRAHLTAHDVTQEALVGSSDVPMFTGFDRVHERTFASAGCRAKLGVGLLALGFGLQLASYLLA